MTDCSTENGLELHCTQQHVFACLKINFLKQGHDVNYILADPNSRWLHGTLAKQQARRMQLKDPHDEAVPKYVVCSVS